jgi:hypothetical protein
MHGMRTVPTFSFAVLPVWWFLLDPHAPARCVGIGVFVDPHASARCVGVAAGMCDDNTINSVVLNHDVFRPSTKQVHVDQQPLPTQCYYICCFPVARDIFVAALYSRVRHTLLRKAAGILEFDSLNVVPRMSFEAITRDPSVFALFRLFVCSFVSPVVAAFGSGGARVGTAPPPSNLMGGPL